LSLLLLSLCICGDADLLAGRHVGGGALLAQLQGANVGDDLPAIINRNLRRVIGHCAEAVADNVENITDRRLPQTILVIRRRLLVAAFGDHALTVAEPSVTDRAIDVETLLAAIKRGSINRKWKHRREACELARACR